MAKLSIVMSICLICAIMTIDETCGRYQLLHPAKKVQGRADFFDAYLFDNSANSSFGFAIPLFSVTVPGYGREHADIDQFRSVNFGNLALLGMTVLGSINIFYPILASNALNILNTFGGSNFISNFFPFSSRVNKRDVSSPGRFSVDTDDLEELILQIVDAFEA